MVVDSVIVLPNGAQTSRKRPTSLACLREMGRGGCEVSMREWAMRCSLGQSEE